MPSFDFGTGVGGVWVDLGEEEEVHD
jgi:hypothetical protein